MISMKKTKDSSSEETEILPTGKVVWTFNGVMVNNGLKYYTDSSHTLTVNSVFNSSELGYTAWAQNDSDIPLLIPKFEELFLTWPISKDT